MARLVGKFLKGIVGNTTLKTWRNQQILQMKIQSPKQTTATKKSANLFGKASSLAKIIRDCVGPGAFYDGTMVNRFNTENLDILRQCFNKETEQFVFTENSFDHLKSFEFNVNSKLKNFLWITPEVSIIDDTLRLNLPEIKIPDEWRFPGEANFCTMYIEVGVFALKARYERDMQTVAFDIGSTMSVLPAQEWSFEISGGCLCVVALHLTYYKKDGNIQTMINTKEFNPSAICGALYNPGEFVIPEQPDPHRSQVLWQAFGLKLE